MQATVTPPGAAAPTLALTPIRTGIPTTGGTLEVLVRVQAPAQPVTADASAVAKPRPALRLALVVDRSGSMAGQPLSEALRCVGHIADQLQGTDQVAVVLYDHEVQVPVPLRAAGNPDAVRAALSGVDSGGSTDLHAGWDAGARELLLATPGTLSRVILLSDGQANHGHVDPVFISERCAYWLERGVSTTTVGLGRGFNEELMLAMAGAGGGQQYYGQTAEDLFDGFDEELALLQSMFLRKLRIKLIPGPGVVIEPLGMVRQNDDGTLSLSDLAWAAESWLLVRLHVAAASLADGQRVVGGMDKRALLSATLEANDLQGSVLQLHGGVVELDNLDRSAWNDLPQDETVAQRLQEVNFGAAAMQVRGLLVAGDIKGARARLGLMEVVAGEHPWLRDKLVHLKQLADDDAAMAAKEMRYSSMKMSSRLASVEEVRYCMSETDSSEVPAFLRRKASEGTGRRQ
jgi:Ca-activated chloride channel family protein